MQYKHLCKELKYISQDFGSFEGEDGTDFSSGYQWDSKKCDIISDITEIPIKSGSFQQILCSEVLEHLPRPREAIRELSRILKVGGEMLITAPFACSYHQEPYFFQTGFSKYFYYSVAEEFNLEIKEIVEVGSRCNILIRDLNKIIRIISREQLKHPNISPLINSYRDALNHIQYNKKNISKIIHNGPESYFVIFNKKE